MEGRTLQEDGTGRCDCEAGETVRVWYQGVSVKVKVNDVPSLSFETKVGVRQGDVR
jgi:hypothetical protein